MTHSIQPKFVNPLEILPEARSLLTHNTNPSDVKAQKIMTQMFQSDDLFCTPPGTPPLLLTGSCVPIPPTPTKTSPMSKDYEPFNNPVQLLECPPNRLAINLHQNILQNIRLNGFYNTSNGEKICIQQPPQGQSCGVGVILMLMHDFKIQVNDLNSFTEWCISSRLLNPPDMIRAVHNMTNVQSMGLEFKTSTLSDYSLRPNRSKDILSSKFEAILKILGSLQSESKSSIIIDITHETLHGHWIIIDGIQEKSVFIRDPFKGKAYELSDEDLFKNLLDSDLKLIYVGKASS